MALSKACTEKGFRMSDPAITSVFHPQFGEIVFSSLTPEGCQWLIEHGFAGLQWIPPIPPIVEPKKP